MQHAPRRAIAAILVPMLAVTACGGGDGQPATPADSVAGVAITAADRAEAKSTFETVCFACHGLSGRGDGPASATLTPKPRDFADPGWQQAVDDAHIERTIVFGGAAVGKSPMMPGHPHLRAKASVLRALVEHVRRLAQP